jgi:alkylated DNA repair dioxygenase AlkB
MNQTATCNVVDRLAKAGANVEYVPRFLSEQAASELMQRLLAAIEFDDPDASLVFVHGRWHRIPRLQAAYGDSGTAYRFSGAHLPARPWIEPLADLRQRLRDRTGIESNFVLINYYGNGASSIGWHSDDEADLGAEPTIVSLSLGAEREFQFRRKVARGMQAPPIGLRLGHGSLLLMRHPTNRDFQHQLPKRGGSRPDRIGPRLNLTWRRIGSRSSNRQANRQVEGPT